MVTSRSQTLSNIVHPMTCLKNQARISNHNVQVSERERLAAIINPYFMIWCILRHNDDFYLDISPTGNAFNIVLRLIEHSPCMWHGLAICSISLYVMYLPSHIPHLSHSCYYQAKLHVYSTHFPTYYTMKLKGTFIWNVCSIHFQEWLQGPNQVCRWGTCQVPF